MISKIKTRASGWFAVGHYVLLSFIAIVFLFPVVFMFISSLKPNLQLLRDTSSLRAFLPVGDISLNNYVDAFRRVPIIRFLFNSILVTTTTVAMGLFVNSMAGFSFAHLRWRGKSIILALVIATIILPFESIAISLMMVVSRLPAITVEGIRFSWLNSYHVQIIPFIAHSFQVFLFYQFFREMPHELIESAQVEGASYFHIYRKIVMPLSGPVLATATVLRSLEMWNQYLWPLITIQSERFRPVMVGLQYFFQLNIEWGEIMAYLSAITAPILIFYFLLQRVFIESIASTGVKG